jgi:hypothetical protein
LAESHCIWEKGKETKVTGSHLELVLQKIDESSKFSCPKHCQRICAYKKRFTNEPIQDGFIFTTIMLQLRNTSSETLVFSESPTWISLFDTNNSSYSIQEVCKLCEDFIQERYGGTKTTKNVRQLREGAEANFFLFFPKLRIGAKAAKLRIESWIEKEFTSGHNWGGDIFVVWIGLTEKRNTKLEDFPMEVAPNKNKKLERPFRSEQVVAQEPSAKDDIEPTLNLYSQYRLRQNLSELPLIRIKPVAEIERTEHDVLKQIELVEESAEDRETEPTMVLRPMRPRRRYYWSIEDRRIFTYREMMSEHNGYCEGCENYGSLFYSEGLFLCRTCRDLLHEY